MAELGLAFAAVPIHTVPSLRAPSRDNAMNSIFASRKWLVLALLVAGAPISGCAHRGYVDSAFGDRHLWDAREMSAYRQWEVERRVTHVDFQLRDHDEQWAYWNWRHSNPRLTDAFKAHDRW
jgi:hypothetical protein